MLKEAFAIGGMEGMSRFVGRKVGELLSVWFRKTWMVRFEFCFDSFGRFLR